jgi:chemotaxis receptor (MCP) glutamine deamidase CheD
MANLDAVFLLPGDTFVSDGCHRITTILGTCVSVCLYNHKTRHAGMNHYVHPQFKGKDVSKAIIGEYGDLSLEYMIHQMFEHDPQSKNYSAKVYGGGMAGSSINQHFNIADLNIQMAKKIMASYHIGVDHWDVRNRGGVKIVFDTSKNIVFKLPLLSSLKRSVLQSSKKKRVLIVEDSKSYGLLLRQIIERHADLEVIAVAENAYNAREIIVRDRPDVMILDLLLPQVSGVQFLKKVMQYFPMPVVMISGKSREESDLPQQCLNHGAKAVLNKRDITFYGSDKSKHADNPVTKAILRALEK